MKVTLAILLFWCFLIDFSFSQRKNTEVYITISEECPVCMYMTKSLKELEEKYGDKAKFVLVFPNALSHYKSIHKFKKKYGLLNFETILDEDQSFVKKYTLTVTPEVMVLDSSGNTIYKGRINDGYYAPGKMKRSSISNDLEIALELWLNDKKKLENWGEAIGCYITIKK